MNTEDNARNSSERYDRALDRAENLREEELERIAMPSDAGLGNPADDALPPDGMARIVQAAKISMTHPHTSADYVSVLRDKLDAILDLPLDWDDNHPLDNRNSYGEFRGLICKLRDDLADEALASPAAIEPETASEEAKKWRALYEAQIKLFDVEQSRRDRAARMGLPDPTQPERAQEQPSEQVRTCICVAFRRNDCPTCATVPLQVEASELDRKLDKYEISGDISHVVSQVTPPAITEPAPAMQSIGEDPEYRRLEVEQYKTQQAFNRIPTESNGAIADQARLNLCAYIDRLLAARQPAAPGVGARDGDLNEVVKFLMGAEPLEGVIFGERHPTKQGLFWWRLNLRAAMCRLKG